MHLVRLRRILAPVLLLVSACGAEEAKVVCPEGWEASGKRCLATTGELAGRVTFADRQQSPGIQVALLGTDRIATSDPAGAYAFHDLRPGTYALQATAPGYEPALLGELTVISRQRTEAQALTLTPQRAFVSGTVSLADEGPLAGTSLTLASESDPTAHWSWSATESTFLLPVPGGGRYRLVASHAGYADASTSVDVAAGATAEAGALVLERTTGSVRGVVELDGDPGAGATIFATGTDAFTTSGVDGSFVLDSIPAVTWTLVVMREGWLTKSVEATVAAGQLVDVGTIRLAPATAAGTGNLHGHAERLGERDHAGIAVTLRNGPVEREYTVLTDADGAWSINGIPAGGWELLVASPGLEPQVRAGIVVLPGDLEAPFVELSRARKIDPRPAMSAAMIDGQAVVSFEDGVASFDPGTNEWRPLADRWASLYASGGGFATVFYDGLLRRLDLSTGAFAPVLPGGWPVAILAGTTWYRTSSGDLYAVEPSSTVGELRWDSSCIATDYRFRASEIPGFDSLAIERHCAGSEAPAQLYVDRITGEATPAIGSLFPARDGEHFVFVAFEQPDPSIAQREHLGVLDATTAEWSLVLEDLSAINWRSMDLMLAQGPIDSDGRGTLMSIVPSAGAVLPLATDAKLLNQWVGTDRALAEIGPSRQLQLLDLAAGAAHSVCNAPTFLQTNPSAIFCNDGWAIHVVDPRSGALEFSRAGYPNARLVGQGAGVLYSNTPTTMYLAHRSGGWVEHAIAMPTNVLAESEDGTALVITRTSPNAHFEVVSTATGAALPVMQTLTDPSWLATARCSISPTGVSGICIHGCSSGTCGTAFQTNGISLQYSLPVSADLGRVVWSRDELHGWGTYGNQLIAIEELFPPWVGVVGNASGYLLAVGNNGLALTMDWNTGAMTTVPRQGPSRQVVSSSAGYQQLRDSSDFLVYPHHLVRLDAGAVVDLGSDARDIRTSLDGSSFSWISGDDRLQHYAPATGQRTLADHVRLTRWYEGRLFYSTDFDGRAGDLQELLPDGNLQLVAPHAEPLMLPIRGSRMLVRPNANLAADTSELAELDLQTGTLRPITTDGRLADAVEVIGDRVVFNAVTASGVEARVVALDGQGLRTLGAPMRQLLQLGDGSRLVWIDEDDLLRIESPGGAGLAVDRAGPIGPFGLTPDATSWVYQRYDGTWFVQLP